MKYHEYLLNVLKWECPFCKIKKEYLLAKTKYFSIILARAPYADNHILIVPNRHIIRLNEITNDERKNLVPLIENWTKKLEKIHKEITLLLRDWIANGIAGKSIDHLHFHLVPDCAIYAKSCEKDRKLYSDSTLAKKTQSLKNKIKLK